MLPEIVAMLNFFDEDPSWVLNAIDTAASSGATMIVAVDGAYSRFPQGRARSQVRTTEAVRAICETRQLGLLLYQPREVWKGDEVAKRKVMLELALAITKPRDWLMILDADYRWQSDIDLRLKLEETIYDIAQVDFTDVTNADGTPVWQPANLLMRARRGLHMKQNHYTYYLPYGAGGFDVLDRSNRPNVCYLRNDVRVRHLVHQRDPQRRAQQVAYYERRDREGTEQP